MYNLVPCLVIRLEQEGLKMERVTNLLSSPKLKIIDIIEAVKEEQAQNPEVTYKARFKFMSKDQIGKSVITILEEGVVVNV